MADNDARPRQVQVDCMTDEQWVELKVIAVRRRQTLGELFGSLARLALSHPDCIAEHT